MHRSMKRTFVIAVVSILLCMSCQGPQEKEAHAKQDEVTQTVLTDSSSVNRIPPRVVPPNDTLTDVRPVESPYAHVVFTTEAIYSKDLGWGYTISMEGKKVVHQPQIPAASGGKGFKTEADALKTARLVVDKIKQNKMPPSISLKELDSLGISY